MPITTLHGRLVALAPAHALEVVGLHQLGDTLAADLDTFLLQLGVDPRDTVGASGGIVDLHDALPEPLVLSSPCRGLALAPGEVAALGHAEHRTHRLHWVVGPVRVYESESLDGIEPLSLANQAAAFLRNSLHRFSGRHQRIPHLSSTTLQVAQDALLVLLIVVVGTWVGIADAMS